MDLSIKAFFGLTVFVLAFFGVYFAERTWKNKKVDLLLTYNKDTVLFLKDARSIDVEVSKDWVAYPQSDSIIKIKPYPGLRAIVTDKSQNAEPKTLNVHY